MRKQQRYLQISEEHHSYLTKLLAKGSINVRIARRASAFLQLHRGTDLNKIAAALGVVYQTVAAWRDQYFESGLDFLSDKPRPGRPNFFDGIDCARITSLACSDAPSGHARWSLRLLAEKAVELALVEEISYSKVRAILKKTS